MSTLASADGGKTYVSNATDLSGSTSLAPGETKYYRTEILNSGSSAQSVSLFLSQLDLGETPPSDSFYLGVNGPLKTYKNYSSTNISSEPVRSEIKLKNVYVGFNTAQTYTPTNYQVHWWVNNNNSDNGDADVQAYFNPNKTGSYNNGTYNMTYATIPWRADSVKLRQPSLGDNGWYGNDNTDVNTNNTIIHYYWDNNYQAGYYKSSAAAGLDTYYSSAKVAVGETVSIPAVGQGTITYTSSNTGVATVSSTGVVTGVKSGTATITATSMGVYGDTITATCTVNVYQNTASNAFDVPIVTNYKIAATFDPNTPVIEYVYWYIKNDSSQTLTYSVSDVYLSL